MSNLLFTIELQQQKTHLYTGARRTLKTFIKKRLTNVWQYQIKPYLCTAFERKWIDFVAQLVEHNTFNVGALGSNPSGITNKTARNYLIVTGCFVLSFAINLRLEDYARPTLALNA